jgi:hypothetical protein
VRCAHCGETVATGLPAWSELPFQRKILTTLQAIFAPHWLALHEFESTPLIHYQARAFGIFMNLLYLIILAAILALIPESARSLPWPGLIIALLLSISLGWFVFLNVILIIEVSQSRRYTRNLLPPVWDGGL